MDRLQAALRYAEKGMPVIPLHSCRNGRCTCGKHACDRAAKHPYAKEGFAPHGLKDATREPSRINDWFARMPLNVGMLTGVPEGEEAGVVVVDADPKNGGIESARALAREYPALARTLRAKTGGGGYHFLFRVEAGMGIRNSQSVLAPGIDVRGDGGYIVAPPSLHVSGLSYSWDNRSQMLPIPCGLENRLRDLGGAERASGGAVKNLVLADGTPGAVIPRGTINATLVSVGGAIRALGCTESEILTLFHALRERCEEAPSDAQLAQWAKSTARYSTKKPVPQLVAEVVKNLDYYI